MIEMCTLTGWQGTTINPDMSDSDKLAILTTRFGKIASEDDPTEMYAELLDLSAAAMGWAQGIARIQKRDHRAMLRAKRKAKARKGDAKKDKDG